MYGMTWMLVHLIYKNPRFSLVPAHIYIVAKINKNTLNFGSFKKNNQLHIGIIHCKLKMEILKESGCMGRISITMNRLLNVVLMLNMKSTG